MALEKTDISIDLVQGASTKVNPQIDTSFHEMVNVTFDGDMTAKKMKGYDLLDTLPTGEKYSLLSRRQADLIAQSDKGTYKYIKELSRFKKISDMGSCEINSNECPGLAFAFSTNYQCFVNYSPALSTNYVTDGEQRFNFFTKEGVYINGVRGSISLTGQDLNPSWKARTTKVVSVMDDFFILDLVGGSEQDGTNIQLSILKFIFNPTTAKFEYVNGGVTIVTNSPTIGGFDMFSDGVNIFLMYINASEKKMYKINPVTNAIATTRSIALTMTSGFIELHNKSSTEFYISAKVGVNQVLFPVSKVSMIESAGNVISGVSATSINIVYPTSDTTAIVVSFITTPSTGVVSLIPMGKIFMQNGNYYFPALQYTTNNISTVLFQIIDTFLIARGVSDTGQVSTDDSTWVSYTAGFRTSQNAQMENSVWYYTSLTPDKRSVLVSFDYDAKETNSYIEIEKTNVFSGGMLGYYDGEEYTEYGFIGNPYISNYATTSPGGGLPADTGYMFCFLYRWEDAQGNTFYSPRGPIYSGFDPVNGITLPANSTVTFNLQAPCITNKKKIVLEVYVKRKNTLFLLHQSRNVYSDFSATTLGTYAITINSFPASSSKVMPYQDGSIAPEVASNSVYIALYADRLFRISKDNPISLAYSQRKLNANGFEINDSFLYLDVLDKRGIAEDELTGCIAMDGRLVIFKQTSVLYIVGSGPSRANTQDDFSEPQLVVSDVGCTESRSIILVPDGIMFKSDKGIYLLNRKLQAGYIGSDVEQFNSYTIISAILLENKNEVRFATLEGVIMVYNYLSSAWSWFTDFNSISACLFNGKYAVLNSTGQILLENPAHNKLISNEIIQTIASPWLRLNKIQGYQKAYYVRIIGYYKTLHRLKMNVYYDYELYSSEEYIIDPLAEDQYNIEIKPTNEEIEDGTAINGVYQMKIDLVRKNCQAVRVVIEDIPLDFANNTGECFALSNITVNIGLKKGLAKLPSQESY